MLLVAIKPDRWASSWWRVGEVVRREGGCIYTTNGKRFKPSYGELECFKELT